MRLRGAVSHRRTISHGAHPQVTTVVRGGVEPPTFRFSGGRSYQLSYLTLAGTIPGKLAAAERS
jgi:hypothetical protein